MKNKACNIKRQNKRVICNRCCVSKIKIQQSQITNISSSLSTSATGTHTLPANGTYSLSLKNSFRVLLKFREYLTKSRLRTSSAWSVQNYHHNVTLVSRFTTPKHTAHDTQLSLQCFDTAGWVTAGYWLLSDLTQHESHVHQSFSSRRSRRRKPKVTN